MKYEEFKEELLKQININASYFKPKENQTLNDFVQTIKKEDFEGEIDK